MTNDSGGHREPTSLIIPPLRQVVSSKNFTPKLFVGMTNWRNKITRWMARLSTPVPEQGALTPMLRGGGLILRAETLKLHLPPFTSPRQRRKTYVVEAEPSRWNMPYGKLLKRLVTDDGGADSMCRTRSRSTFADSALDQGMVKSSVL
jgi:hypothetical protein